MVELLTIEEVAERLRVSVLTVRWLRQNGRFAPAIKVGRRLLWDSRDVAAWLKSQRERRRWRDGSPAIQAVVWGSALSGAGEVTWP